MEHMIGKYPLSLEECKRLLEFIDENPQEFHQELRQNTLHVHQEESPLFDVILPPLISLTVAPDSLNALLDLPSAWEETPNYLIVLIEAGQAALGYFEEGVMDSHKVIRKYMVRAKQGKVQLNHLKTKGKSRLGSRIRLQQTQEFFEEINEKLQEWEVEHVDWVFYKSSILLWNGLFEASVSPPFEKRDERLRKIPRDLPTPTYALLLDLNQYLLEGELKIFSEDYEDILDEL